MKYVLSIDTPQKEPIGEMEIRYWSELVFDFDAEMQFIVRLCKSADNYQTTQIVSYNSVYQLNQALHLRDHYIRLIQKIGNMAHIKTV